MATSYLVSNTDSPPSLRFRIPKRRTAPSYEDELTKNRLREALAREDTLRRQIDELTRRQQEVLNSLFAGQEDAAKRVKSLTPRQREIMTLVLAGHPSKNIAADLGISQRSVESHRASIMKKTGSKSIPALATLALAAAWTDAPHPSPGSELLKLRPKPKFRELTPPDSDGRLVVVAG